MSKNDLKYHLAAIVIYFIISIISTSYLFISDKDIITEYRDIIRFPSEKLHQDIARFTWNNLGSNPNMEDIARFYIYIPSYFLSVENLSRFYSLIFYFLLGIVPFISIYYLSKDFLKLSQRHSFLLAMVLSFVYSINPYMVQSNSPPNTYVMSYSILPAIILVTINFLRAGDFKSKLLLTILITLAITQIIRYVIFVSILFFLTMVIYILLYNRTFHFIRQVIVRCLILVVLLLLFNMYWLMPTVGSLGYKTMAPTYSLNYEMTKIFSSAYTISDILMLTASWWPTLSLKFLFSENISVIFLLVIPILVILSILLWRLYSKEEKTLLLIGVSVSITGIFLWNGFNGFSIEVYKMLLFSTPLSIGWMFRVPSYFGIFTVLGYVLCICVMLCNILRKKEILFTIFTKQKIVKLHGGHIAIFLLLILILSSLVIGWQRFTGDLDGVLKNGYYIKDREHYDLAQYNKSIVLLVNYTGNFRSYHTGKPFLELNGDLKNYIVSKLENGYDSSLINLISIAGADALITNQKVDDTQDLYLYPEYKDGINIYLLKNKSSKFRIPNNLASVPYFDNVFFGEFNSSEIFLIQNNEKHPSGIVIDPSVNLLHPDWNNFQIIEPYKYTIHYDPSSTWSKGATNDPLHGEFHPYLKKIGSENWDSDYGKGIVFNLPNTLVYNGVNLSDKDILTTYTFENNLSEWNINSEEIQTINLVVDSYLGKYSVLSILNESKWGWKTINSPLVPVNNLIPYRWVFYVKGENSYGVHAKIAEYDKNKKIVNINYLNSIDTGTFSWKEISFDYRPEDKNTVYMQLQIWHGHETTQPLPNRVWINDVKIYNLSGYIKPVSLDMDLNIDHDDKYYLFMRYFKNKNGGIINISIGEKAIKFIDTKDQLNKFVWGKVATLDLKKGKYKLTLTNDHGFNAVNIFTLIPEKEYQEMEKKLEPSIEGKRLINVFEAESDLYRIDANISNKYGGKASNGEVLEFNGTSRAWQIVDIIRPDNYKIALKVNGNFEIKFDNIKHNISSNLSDFVYIGPIYLTKGYHKIEITKHGNESKESDLDVVWLYSTNNTDEKIEDIFRIDNVPATILNYIQVDPTLYKIKVNATKPFMVSFAESYDPLWTAKIDKIDGKSVKSEIIRPIPLYSIVNGFWINQTGDLDITVEYEPQRWFYTGAAVSITTLIICIAYFIFDWRRKNGIKNK